MIVKRVKLLDQGFKGIEVLFDAERKISDQMKAKRDNTVKESFPLPIPLRQKFHQLKYFFLVLSGIWREEWTPYLLDDCSGLKTVDQIVNDAGDDIADENQFRKMIAKELMGADTAFQNTKIEGYEIIDQNVKIMGKYEVVEGKPFAIKLPFISDEDDFSLHEEVISVMDELSSEVVKYLKEEQIKLEDIKGMLLEFTKSDKDRERIKEQNEEENYAELMDKLESQAIVIPLEGTRLEQQIEENGYSKAEIASNNTIDNSRFDNDNEKEEKSDDEFDNEKEPPDDTPIPESEEPDDKDDEVKYF